jgi:hypothetical protein
MAHPKVKIADNSGNEVGVTNNRLDVNATLGVGSSTFTSYPQITQSTSEQTLSVALSATVTTCKEIIFQTDPTNAGYIMVKDDDSDLATEGIRLYAGDMLTLPVSSTSNVSLDASQASQKVNICIIT